MLSINHQNMGLVTCCTKNIVICWWKNTKPTDYSHCPWSKLTSLLRVIQPNLFSSTLVLWLLALLSACNSPFTYPLGAGVSLRRSLRNQQDLEGHLPSLAGHLEFWVFLALGFMLCKHCHFTGTALLSFCWPEHCSAERELQPRFLAQWEGVAKSEKVKVLFRTRESVLILCGNASFLKESFWCPELYMMWNTKV